MIAGYLGFASVHLVHDKVVHFVTFFILTAEFYYVFDTAAVRTLRWLTVVICTVGGSVGLEFIQSLVNPARVFDVKDIACNVAGSAMAVALCSIRRKRTVTSIELQSFG